MSAKAQAMGECQGFWIEGNQEGIRRRELEGCGEGRWCHTGKSNAAGTIDESIISHVILRDGA